MKSKLVVSFFSLVLFVVLFFPSNILAAPTIYAKDVTAFDNNDVKYNLQQMLDFAFPTSTATLLRNLTAANLTILTDGSTTTLHAHSSGPSTTTLDDAYNNDSGERTVTVDNGDIAFDLNDSTNDYTLQIDNTTTGEIADALLFATSGVGGTVVDAIDVSDGGITNAINVGDNVIATNGATIGSNDASIVDFLDFDVSADGVVLLTPDTDADTITITPSAAFTTD